MRTKCWFVLGMWMIAASVAKAQGPGDWNGDGAVNAGDLPGLTQCMTGPNGTLGPTCGAFGFEQSGFVGMTTALAMLAVLPPTINCTPYPDPCGSPDGGRGYIFANYPDQIISACRSSMRKAFPSVCADGDNNLSPAFSAIWIGMQQEDEVTQGPCVERILRWAQCGWIRSRGTSGQLPPPPSVVNRIYAEWSGDASTNDPNAYDIEFRSDLPGSGFVFSGPILLNQQTGLCAYSMDNDLGDLQIFNLGAPGYWQGWCNRASWTSEVYNIQDRVPGRVLATARFSDCRYYLGPAYVEAQPDFIQVVGPRSTNPLFLRFQVVGTDAYELWDSRP